MKSCVYKKCPPGQGLQNGECTQCKQGFGYDDKPPHTCKRCMTSNCDICTFDYTKCDTTKVAISIIENAKGYVGALTFTLMWHGEVDLDLWFNC